MNAVFEITLAILIAFTETVAGIGLVILVAILIWALIGPRPGN